MLPNHHWQLPEGIEELLPDAAVQIERLRRRLLDLFATWGYQLVIPPFIEFLDALLTGTGHDLDLQTFKLTDQISGRLLGVRADMTPQVARIDARNLKREVPTRLCYLGTVLQTRGDHLEKSRSPLQVGAELYGHAGITGELEVIRLMLEMLALVGVQEVHLDLGHVGIYRGLARQAGLDGAQEAELFDALQRKARAELIELLDRFRPSATSRSMLLSLADLNGTGAVIEQARTSLAPAGAEVKAALSDLEAVAGELRGAFPVLPINFDLAELRGYHYHTGIVFAAFAPGYGREIARGGRYDEIGKVFGRARPATGFSADLKILARLGLEDRDGTPEAEGAIFAPCVKDPDLDSRIRDLRTSGRVVIGEMPGQSGGAAAMGCRYTLQKGKRAWEIVPL